MHSLSSEAILLESIGADFVIYQNTFAGTEITDDFDVMNWSWIQQIKLPMLKRFAYIIYSVTPSQTEKETDFSLAGIYTESLHANISVEMLSDLIFINRNSAALCLNSIIDVFVGSLDAVDNIFDDMDSNPDASEDANDTE